MSTNDDSRTLSSLPILDASNFQDWKWNLESHLRSADCWDVVEAEVAEPPLSATPEPGERMLLAQHRTKLSKAVGAITRSATRTHRTCIEPYPNKPHKMWTALCALYENKDAATRFRASTLLHGATKMDNESWSTFVTRIEELAYNYDKLRPSSVGANGWTLEKEFEETKAWIILNALPTNNTLRTSLIQTNNITTSEIRAAFIRQGMDDMLKPNEPSESAHAASFQPPPSQTPSQTSTNRNPGSCNYCRKPGHWELECRKKKRDYNTGGHNGFQPQGAMNRGFGDSYHGGNRGGAFRGNFGGHGTPNFNYGNPGGYAHANSAEFHNPGIYFTPGPGFPSYPNSQSYGPYPPPGQGFPTYLQHNHHPDHNSPSPLLSTFDTEVGPTEFAGNASTSLSLSLPLADIDWIADSGASTHMTSHKEWLRDFKVVRRPVKLADGSVIYAEGEGWIRFEPRLGQKESPPFYLLHVLYVPRLKTNLLSTQSLTRDSSHTVLFADKHVEIRKGNSIVLTGSINKQNTFYLDGETTLAESALSASTLPATLSTWHRRFIHQNYDSLRKLLRSKAVNDYKVNGEGSAKEQCIACLAGKQHRAPHSKPAERAGRLLGRVFSDLHGPMQVEGRGGYRYWISFIDDMSRYTAVYFLRKKSDTFQAFKDYKALAENQLNVKIQRLRDDKGGEFISNEFNDFCRTHGIHREHTIRDTPQQNGVAERFNQTLQNAVRTMLFESAFADYHWVDAASAFTHVHNRSPSSSIARRTPFELWYGKKPSVKNFRAWACLAYVHLQKSQHLSLHSQTKRCVFIGYAKNYKGWVFWDPESGKEIISDSAYFFEDVFPGGKKAPKPPARMIQVSTPNTPFPEIDRFDRRTAPAPPIPRVEPIARTIARPPPTVATPISAPSSSIPTPSTVRLSREARALTKHFESHPAALPSR